MYRKKLVHGSKIDVIHHVVFTYNIGKKSYEDFSGKAVKISRMILSLLSN